MNRANLCVQFSLSQRERAGVRENRSSENCMPSADFADGLLTPDSGLLTYQRPHLIPQHNPLQIVRFRKIKNNNWHLVIHA